MSENDALSLFDNGNALADRGEYRMAVDAYRQALAIEPELVDARHNLGVLYLRMGRVRDAVECLEAVHATSPHLPDVRGNLASALLAAGEHDRALVLFMELSANNPHSASYRFNLGTALFTMAKYHEAQRCFAEALCLDPSFARGWNNYGYALLKCGDHQGALEAFEKSLALDPETVDAHWNRATALLAEGRYTEGWKEFAWRWQRADFLPESFRYTMPEWDGRVLENETLLVHAEQGFGDTLHFSRYLEEVRRRCRRVVFECQSELAGLYPAQPGFTVIPRGGVLPAVHYHVPLLSLPGIFAVTPESITAVVPYLCRDVAPPCHEWTDLYTLTVGLVWSGSETNKEGRDRSVPVEVIAGICDVPGCRFVSLQTGSAAGSLHGMCPDVDEVGSTLRDFTDSAAAIGRCDIIVSVDTATAHLAGAMGKKVWTLLNAAPDWRWQLQDTTTLWYPTMTLFRQRSHGEWRDVIDRVSAALATLAVGEKLHLQGVFR